MSASISVILPAHNEEAHIAACARALLASRSLANDLVVEVLVVANGCTDNTAKRARDFEPHAQALGWNWRVLELPYGSKLGALNAGDQAATGGIRVYLDADVCVDPDLLSELAHALPAHSPRYSSGTPRLTRAQSWISRAYGRFWITLPFVTHGVPGFGVFAMNATGRARWQEWPDIISDDTFARLSFAPSERVRVKAGYTWPLVEGFENLIRVRRRQNAGVSEVARLFPQLVNNDDTPRVTFAGLLVRLLRDPIGFGVYTAVSLAVKTRLFASSSRWVRGR